MLPSQRLASLPRQLACLPQGWASAAPRSSGGPAQAAAWRRCLGAGSHFKVAISALLCFQAPPGGSVVGLPAAAPRAAAQLLCAAQPLPKEGGPPPPGGLLWLRQRYCWQSRREALRSQASIAWVLAAGFARAARGALGCCSSARLLSFILLYLQFFCECARAAHNAHPVGGAC